MSTKFLMFFASLMLIMSMPTKLHALDGFMPGETDIEEDMETRQSLTQMAALMPKEQMEDTFLLSKNMEQPVISSLTKGLNIFDTSIPSDLDMFTLQTGFLTYSPTLLAGDESFSSMNDGLRLSQLISNVNEGSQSLRLLGIKDISTLTNRTE